MRPEAKARYCTIHRPVPRPARVADLIATRHRQKFPRRTVLQRDPQEPRARPAPLVSSALHSRCSACGNINGGATAMRCSGRSRMTQALSQFSPVVRIAITKRRRSGFYRQAALRVGSPPFWIHLGRRLHRDEMRYTHGGTDRQSVVNRKNWAHSWAHTPAARRSQTQKVPVFFSGMTAR